MADLRNVINELLDTIAADNPQAIRELVESTLSSEKEREEWVTICCKECGETRRYSVRVKMPDFKERTKALQILLDQAKGKPAETLKLEGGLTIRAQNITNEIPDMSREQLNAVIESAMTEQELKAVRDAIAAAETGDLDPLAKLGYFKEVQMPGHVKSADPIYSPDEYQAIMDARRARLELEIRLWEVGIIQGYLKPPNPFGEWNPKTRKYDLKGPAKALEAAKQSAEA
jgi:hypothetical protein